MFDIVIAKNELLSRLLIVAGAVDKRQSLAILANILLKVSNDGFLVLTATDLEMEISAKVACKEVNAVGEITVPAKKLIDIIRSLDDETLVVIKLVDKSLIIKAKRSQFKLGTLPVDDFPARNHTQAEFSLDFAKSDLLSLMQATHFAMSQQDVRFFLNSLLLELDGEHIITVATDGHRMAIYKFQYANSAQHQRFLLPRKTILEMIRLLNVIHDEKIVLSLGGDHACLQTADYKFTSKLIDSRYPSYQKVVSNDYDKFVLVDCEDFKRALMRISILAHEKSRAVLLHIHDNVLTLIANNQEQEEATDSIEAQVDGEEIKIGVNAGYLLDVLNYFPIGLVRLSLSTADSTILVETLANEDYQYVIMPMKI